MVLWLLSFATLAAVAALFAPANADEGERAYTITQILDASGDGTHPLDYPIDIAVDGDGNVYVPGAISDNVFKITPSGAITQILDASGDGTHAFEAPNGIAVDRNGNVYGTHALGLPSSVAIGNDGDQSHR